MFVGLSTKIPELMSKAVNYGYISIVASALDIALLFVLTEIVGIFYLISVVIAYLSGLLLSFILNKKYNFKDENKQVLNQFTKFTSVATFGLLVNLSVIFFMVSMMNIHYILAKIFALGVSFTCNFFGHYYFSFKKLKHEEIND